MDAKRKNLLEAVEWWIEELGIPAVVLALLIAGLLVIAHEFFSPVSLDAAIKKDLQNSEDVASAPPAPAEQLPANN
jgi:Ca2+/H+ antiporter